MISPVAANIAGPLPGFLINIVFAGLFLGAAATPLKKIWGLAAPQFCFGQINAWGQYVIGLGLVFVFLAPVFGVPDVFGNLLEIGFQGGHGTVGGMAHTFDKLGCRSVLYGCHLRDRVRDYHRHGTDQYRRPQRICIQCQDVQRHGQARKSGRLPTGKTASGGTPDRAVEFAGFTCAAYLAGRDRRSHRLRHQGIAGSG